MDILLRDRQNFAGYRSKFTRTFDKSRVNRRYFHTQENYLLKNLTRIYNNHTNAHRNLGSGYFSTVYRIDDKYVLKVSKDVRDINLSKIVFNTNFKFKNLKRYFGETVATVVNNFGTNLNILRNVYTKGEFISAGIPMDLSKRNSYFKNLEYYKNVYLPVFSSLPQWSFDGIAKDCSKLNRISKRGKGENTYIFDYLNPNNFVLAGKTLRIIDEVGHASKRDKKNSVSDLFSVFISNFDMDLVEQFSPEVVDSRRILAKKIILAGVKHELPMSSSRADYGHWIEAIQLLDLGMSDSCAIDMARCLDFITKNNKNPKKRIQLAKKYLDGIFS